MFRHIVSIDAFIVAYCLIIDDAAFDAFRARGALIHA